MDQTIAEMQFGNSDEDTELQLTACCAGHVVASLVTLRSIDGRALLGSNLLTLGQTIQLRDFLNRHIDELALKQTCSLAERSSDDPTRLAAVEEVPASTRRPDPLGDMDNPPARRRWSVEGCGQPLLKPVGSASHCGHYADIVDAFPWLCPACRAASTKYTADKSRP